MYGLLPNDKYKAAYENYSISLVVKCVDALQYCYMLSQLHDGQYNKSIRPNTWLRHRYYVPINWHDFLR